MFPRTPLRDHNCAFPYRFRVDIHDDYRWLADEYHPLFQSFQSAREGSADHVRCLQRSAGPKARSVVYLGGTVQVRGPFGSSKSVQDIILAYLPGTESTTELDAGRRPRE